MSGHRGKVEYLVLFILFGSTSSVMGVIPFALGGLGRALAALLIARRKRRRVVHADDLERGLMNQLGNISTRGASSQMSPTFPSRCSTSASFS